MDATEAEQMARDHFYGVPGMHPDLGFETVGVVHNNNTWRVICRVFSLLTSKRIEYRVNISDDKVQSIEEVE